MKKQFAALLILIAFVSGSLGAHAANATKPRTAKISDLTACHPRGQSSFSKRWMTGHGAYDVFQGKNNMPIFCIDGNSYDPVAKISIAIDIYQDGVLKKRLPKFIFNPKKDGPAIMVDTGGACDLYVVIGEYAELDSGVETTPTVTYYHSLGMCR